MGDVSGDLRAEQPCAGEVGFGVDGDGEVVD
jgi:hypothetical protein